MTGVISQFSTSTGRGCLWAADVLNHRKRWCEKKRKGKNTFIYSYSTDCVVVKETQEIYMCNWDGVWCIQAHIRTHTHIPCCYKRWTLGEVSIENGKLSPASVIDLLLSTLRHSLRVLVCTCLRYRIHTKPLALLKRLYVSNPPQFGAC